MTGGSLQSPRAFSKRAGSPLSADASAVCLAAAQGAGAAAPPQHGAEPAPPPHARSSRARVRRRREKGGLVTSLGKERSRKGPP